VDERKEKSLNENLFMGLQKSSGGAWISLSDLKLVPEWDELEVYSGLFSRSRVAGPVGL
jgi:hypothetical protein